MNSHTVMEVVRFQRSIGAVPKEGSFSIRGRCGHQINALGTTSLRKYLVTYKGVTTYLTFAVLGTRAVT